MRPHLRLLRRVLRLGGSVLAAVALLAVTATPASAHAIGGTEPTNYETRLLSITPQPEGLTVRVIEAGARLELVNTGPEPVTVLGYSGEPYLRVGPDGVEENRRSPSLFANRSIDGSPVPPEADADAEPEWEHVSSEPRVAWHDHRTHWMQAGDPPAVQEAPGEVHVIYPEWTVEVRQGDQTIQVTGDLRWVPGVPVAPWLGLAAVLGIGVFVAGGTRWWAGLLTAGLLLLVAVDVTHAASVWFGTQTSVASKATGSAVSAAGWAVAVLAVWRLRRGPVESGIFFLLFSAALLAVIGGLGDMASLTRSQLVGVLPEVGTRAAVAAKIGLGFGLVLAGLIRLRQTAVAQAQAARADANADGDASALAGEQPDGHADLQADAPPGAQDSAGHDSTAQDGDATAAPEGVTPDASVPDRSAPDTPAPDTPTGEPEAGTSDPAEREGTAPNPTGGRDKEPD